MTFFDDDTSDSADDSDPEPHADAPQLDPNDYVPHEIDVGVAATVRPGGVDLEYITYIDGMPTPTYDDLLAGEPWAHWDDEPGSELDDYPQSPPPADTDQQPVSDICEVRKGWAVIRNPDDSDQWMAMPVDQAIDDLRSAK